MTNCIICLGEIEASLNYLLNKKYKICQKCFKEYGTNIKRLKLDGYNGLSLATYNEFIKKVVLQIKVNKDLALAKELIGPYRYFLKEKYQGYTLIPVPSTSKSDKQRGFNHVKAIFETLDLPILEVFNKAKDYKQSSKNLSQRNEIHSAINLKPNILLPKKILVVDDIITSGNSLKTCLNLLKPYSKQLSFVVFANNCRIIRQNRNRYNTKLQTPTFKI